MLKNKLSKVASFLIIFAIVVSLSLTTLATDEATTLSPDEQASSDQAQPTAEGDQNQAQGQDQNQNPAANKDIVKHDVYLSDDDVTMDQLVDGNVFITGKNVTITGQVNGNLFVAAKNVTFKNSYVVNTAFIAAETVEFDSAANDVYCACKNLTVTYDSYIVRDVHIAAKDAQFLGYVGRNANISAQTINFGNPNEQSSSAYITGSLNYEASKVSFHTDGESEAVNDNDEETFKKVVAGELKASVIDENSDESNHDSNKVNVVDLFSHIFVALIVYLLTIWLLPNKIEEHVTNITKKPVKTLGYGALALIFVPVASILVLCTLIGAPIGLLTLALYGFAILFAKPVVNVALARLVKNKFKLSNIWLEMLAVVAISIVLWAVSLIPYVNFIVRLVITLLGLGFVVLTIFPDKKVKKAKKAKVSKDSKKAEAKESNVADEKAKDAKEEDNK